MGPNERKTNLKNKSIKGLIWSATEIWGTQATQFLTFLILARILGPEVFGLISLSNIFIHFIQTLIGSGFSDAIVQRKHLDAAHLDTAFWANLLIGVILTGLGILGAPAIAAAFQQAELTLIIQWLSLNVLLNALAGVQESVLRRKLDFRGLAIRKVLGLTVGSCVGITLAFLGFGVWSLVAQILTGSLIGVITLWKISDWNPGLRFSFRHFRELFQFGINVIGSSVLFFFSRRGDDLLIGYYLGPVALGYYTIAYKLLVTITQILTETVRKVALPVLSKLQDDLESLRKLIYLSSELMSLIAFPMFVGLSILAPEIILTVFGEQWSASIAVCQVLAFVGIAHSSFFLSSSVINALGKPHWSFAFLMISALVKLTGFAFTVQHGIVAVSFALVLCTYLVEPIRLFMLHKITHINYLTYFSQFKVAAVNSAIMSFAIIVIRSIISQVGWNPSIFVLVIYIISGVIIYIASLLLLSPHIVNKAYELVPVPMVKSVIDRLKLNRDPVK